MRTKKAVINTLVMVVFEAITLICGLILPRYVLTSFGSEYNGIVSSITQFLGFISILCVGIPGATRVALYRTLADNDVDATSSVIKATESYIRKIAYIFLAYIAILAGVLPFISHTTYPFWEVASLVIIIGLGTFANYFFGLTYQMLLQADQRQYVYYSLQSIITILNAVISIILIRFNCSIHVVKLGSSAIFCATPIILNLYVTQKYRINRKAKPDFNALSQRWNAFALGIANVVHNSTDVIVLTLFTNPKTVSVYTVYNLIIAGLKKILTVFTTGIESAFGNMFAKDEQSAIRKNLSLFEYFIGAFASVVFSCAFVLIIPFVKIYTSNVTDVEYAIPLYAFLSVATTVVYAIRIPYMTVVQAAGHYRQTRNGSFVEAGLNIVLSVACVIKLGIIGVAIGTIVADTFRTVQYGWYVCRNLVHISFTCIVKRIAWICMNIALIVAIDDAIVFRILMIGWKQWLIAGVISFMIAVVLVLVSSLVFYREDLTQIIRKIISFAEKKGGMK